MKKLWSSYVKELKLSSKSFYFYIEIVMAAIIIGVLLFFIPEERIERNDEYIHLNMPTAVEEMYTKVMVENDEDGVVEKATLELDKEEIQVDLYITEESNVYVIPDLDTMVELTKSDRPALGADVTFNEETGNFDYTYYLQGYESERLQNLYRIVHVKNVEEITAEAESYEVRSLDQSYVPLNSREMAVPSLLAFNGALMGMFIIAAYVFLDKSEGVIKAYAVTASKVWHYLMSKTLVLTTVTIITTLAITLSVMGTQPNYPMLLVLLITSSFAASSFGLVVASFYDNMMKAFGAIYVAMMILMLPAIAYFIPSWQPFWVTIIPTHFLIQGFKETVLVNGDMGFVWLSSGIFLGVGIILFVWANQRFKKMLAR
jgi:hypothetical protein